MKYLLKTWLIKIAKYDNGAIVLSLKTGLKKSDFNFYILKEGKK